ncbi:hypothetical protein ACFLZ5_00585 [Thermodesulfobacteriota bacterium]
MQQPEFSKTFVRPDGTAVLTCPYCYRQKEISVTSFRGHKHKLKIKCFCKNAFNVFLEFRRRVRKTTQLPGTFINHSQNSSRCHFLVLDVSLIGLTFSSLDASIINEDDELSIEFTLDDGLYTKISRNAVVRNVRPGSIVGVEFEISNVVAGGPLGYYINHG